MNKSRFCVEEELKSAAESLDPEVVQDMKKCLKEMTHSGNPSLDTAMIKRFKQICRKSDCYVEYAFLLIMKELQQKHSEIRLSAFQVADELFNRSHAFRERLVIHLQDFLALTTETELKRPLPPPKAAAKKLETETLHAVQRWYEKYGQGYRKLAIGYDYLKNCRRIDFRNIQAQNIAEQQRIEREEKRKQKVMADKLAKVLKEIEESQAEIRNCAKEAESCLGLLLPRPSDFSFLSSVDEDTSSKECSSEVASHKQDSSSSEKDNDGDKTSVDKLSTLKKANSSHGFKGKKDSELAVSDDLSNAAKEFHANINPESKDEKRKHEKESESKNNDEIIFEEEDRYHEQDEDLQAHGLTRPGHSVTVEIAIQDKLLVQETEDNMDVMRSLKESSKLIISNYLPKVGKWLEVLSKNGAKQEHIKSAIDLKVHLQSIKDKCQDINFISAHPPAPQEADSDDSDFEDVPEKEGFEPRIPYHLREEYGLSGCSEQLHRPSLTAGGSASESPAKLKTTNLQWNLKEREQKDFLSDPTSRAAALARIKKENAESKSGDESSDQLVSSQQTDESSEEISVKKEKKDVPVVQFGEDLEFWDNPDKMEAPTVVKFDSLHRFWAPNEGQSEKASDHGLAALRNRVYSYTGTFEPVKWKCRAPLPNGKLCERMDRVKCPFHGKIIPRDEMGRPSQGEASSSSATRDHNITDRPAGELPPWQDPELQREIEAATGKDLGSARSQKLVDKSKGKGKGRGKKSNLTDIKASKNTTRKRLENKVFSKGSLKRVCNTLDRADYKRVRDKFGSQFQYSMN